MNSKGISKQYRPKHPQLLQTIESSAFKYIYPYRGLPFPVEYGRHKLQDNREIKKRRTRDSLSDVDYRAVVEFFVVDGQQPVTEKVFLRTMAVDVSDRR